MFLIILYKNYKCLWLSCNGARHSRPKDNGTPSPLSGLLPYPLPYEGLPPQDLGAKEKKGKGAAAFRITI